MLEYFVHIDLDDLPEDLVLATADISDSLTRMKVNASQLPANWRQTPAPPELAAIGDEFVQRGRVAILIVPSALAPAESNWLINPVHSGFSKIKLKPAEVFKYNSRFLRGLR
jgi:RES domain-containing protein